MTTAPPSLVTRTLAARRHRFIALLIDNLIFYIAISPIYPLLVEDPEVSEESVLISYLNPYAGNSNWPIEVAVTVLLAVYFWLQHALWGQTLGKRLYRLKVVSSTTGEPPGLSQAGIRALVHPALMLTPYSGVLINLVDALWIFVGPKRQCLHDVIAGTVVVDLSDPNRKGFGGPGFLFGLGIILTLLTALVLFISLVMPK
ncbi:RDD family protein [Streptosporangium sp. LJ11]|uniref:RDD family protein n=1 Tax=Streptosporangium sp. LJ11 TaxID=3436927 RepID=UPI003F7A9AFF